MSKTITYRKKGTTTKASGPVTVIKKGYFKKKRRFPRYQHLISNKQYVAFEYFERFSGNLDAAGFRDIVFNLNSIYDPYRTGVGTTATAYSAWSGLYHRYRVDFTTVQVMLLTAGGAGAILSVLGSNDGASLSTYAQANTQPYTTSKAHGSSGDATTIYKKFYPHKIAGVSKTTYKADDRFESVINNNPTEIICCHVCISDPGNSQAGYNIAVKMKMYAELSDSYMLASP